MGRLANGRGEEEPSSAAVHLLPSLQHPAPHEQPSAGRAGPGQTPPQQTQHRSAPVPKCWARSGTSPEPGLHWKKVPAQTRLPALSPLGAQPEQGERSQAGRLGYVMSFTGHWLSILPFTHFSLAKCKCFFPSTVQG